MGSERLLTSEPILLDDQINHVYKDYNKESQFLHSLITTRNRGAVEILDVACGTGEHARFLNNLFGYQVDGIDISCSAIALAQHRNPSGSFCQANMVNFKLKKVYDVVLCLFSSIGFVKTLKNLSKTFVAFRNHLKEDGIVIVEPWFSADKLILDTMYLQTIEDDNLIIARIGCNKIIDQISFVHLHYLVGSPKEFFHTATTHELGLFTVKETLKCFEDAGLCAQYYETGITGRGLYIASKKHGVKR